MVQNYMQFIAGSQILQPVRLAFVASNQFILSREKPMISQKIGMRSALAILTMTLVANFTTAGQTASPAASAAQQRTEAKQKSRTKKAESKPSAYEENFELLPLQGNSLKTDLSIVGEVDDKPGLPYVRERWHLEWRPGDPIDLYILKPRGVEKPPVILYLYSYPQDTDRFKTDSWGGYATGNGFAAVGFVSALTGHRLGHRPPREDFFNQLPEAIGASVHDVQMILDFLATRKQLDLNRVGMFGQGSGGTIALLASAVDPRIQAVDVLTPWGDWPTFAKESTFIPSEDRMEVNKPEMLASLAKLDPVTWLPKVQAKSVRIQNVRKDGHMPDAAQERLEKAAPEIAEINQYGDAAALVPAAANGRLLEWIKNSLQPVANAVPNQRTERIHFFPGKLPSGSSLGESRVSAPSTQR
jgi:hypothetical protein